MRWTYLVPALAIVLVACGGSHPPTSPSTNPPSGGGSGSGPTVALSVNADAVGSRDAVASLSEVIVDASGSTGTGLTFAIDFGDGTTAASVTAKHVYAAPSTYTVAATVTDAQGRKATMTQQVAVRDATGNWFHASYVQKARRVEVRRLSIEAQTGATVRGTYRVTGDADRAFTGTLIAPRDIRINVNGGTSLIGTLPGRLNDEAVPWPLISAGDSVDGQRLDFRAVTGVIDPSPPAAALRLRFGNNGTEPLLAATPVTVDGTGSRGTDLAYFIEFGDGSMATASQATRIVDVTDVNTYFLTARVTVVDRFGRSDSTASEYFLYDMGVRQLDTWITRDPPYALFMSFRSRSGANYHGTVAQHFGSAGARYAEMTATVGGGDGYDIVIRVPEWGIEYRGTVRIPGTESAQIVVTQTGGAENGQSWRLIQKGYS